MKLVVGLGNPGARYANTRHNVGFRVIDEIAARLGSPTDRVDDSGGRAWVAEARIDSRPVVLAKPNTYMNLSGAAVAELCGRFPIQPSDVLVVYDDADLPLGRIRFRRRGGSGGHRGLRSILEHLDDEAFGRLRVGVRGKLRPREELADYVLREFEQDEQRLVEEVIELAADGVAAWVTSEFSRVMNEFNGRALQ